MSNNERKSSSTTLALSSTGRRTEALPRTHQPVRSAIIVYLLGILGQGLLSLACLLEPGLDGTLVASQLSS